MKFFFMMLIAIALFFYLTGIAQEKLQKERTDQLGDQSSGTQKASQPAPPKGYIKFVK